MTADYLCLLAFQFLQSYLTLAITGVGFGLMVAGGRGASAAAEFFFSRPFLALMTILGQFLAAFSNAFVIFCSASATLFTRYVLDPVLIVLGRVLKKIFFPRRSG